MMMKILPIHSQIKFILLLVCFSANAPAAEQYTFQNTHFIILIQDTKNMAGRDKEIIPRLPELLFWGEDALSPAPNLAEPLPRYDKKNDYISVVYYGIHERRTRCKTSTGKSFRFERLFEWQRMASSYEDERIFQNTLKRWLNENCRRQATNDNPLNIAESLVLAYVSNHLEAPRLFKQIILITVSNQAESGFNLPADELEWYGYRKGYQDIAFAKEINEDTRNYFNIISPTGWIFSLMPHSKQPRLIHGPTVEGYPNPVRIRYKKVLPTRATQLDNLLNYSELTQIERLAISEQKIQVIDAQQLQPVTLTIASTDSLKPIEFKLSLPQDWPLGPQVFPAKKYPEPLAGKKDIRLLFFLNGKQEFYLSPTDAWQTQHTRLIFNVQFQYVTPDIYEHLFIDSGQKILMIEPVKPLELEQDASYPEHLPQVILDNQTLLSQFDEYRDQKGLIQTVARDRIKTDRAQRRDEIIQAASTERMMQTIYIVIGALAALALSLWLFYLCCYHRRFQPRLDWRPTGNIAVDFNKPIPILEIGSVVVINEGKPGWLGRLLLNQKYPDQQVHLQANCDRAQAGELKLAPTDDPLIGFQIAGEHEKPVDNLTYTVSKETPISLYFAAEQIQDINSTKEVNQALSMTLGEKDGLLPLTIKMTWEARGKIEQSILFQVLFKPELGEETPPYIEYLSHADKPFYYEKGEQVTVGEYIFHSKAQHQFAKPFKESFSLKTFKDDLPLVTTNKEAGIQLAIDGQVVVAAKQSVVVPIKVACDGSVIVNPGAEGQVYEFVLKGQQYTIDSQPGPHRFTLQRNPKQADARLKIKRANIEYVLFWEEVGDGHSDYPSYHTIVTGGNKKPKTQQLPEKVLLLEPPAQAFKFGDITDRPREIYQIQLENLGKSGQGYVEADVTAEFMVKSGEQSIIYKDGYSSKDLLLLTTGPLEEESDKHSLIVKVEEGEPPKTIHVKLNLSHAIERIEGALLGIDENNHINENLVISAESTVAVVVDKDAPSPKREHQLTVCVPVALEEKPKPHWLAIDFGTSAIAVATGKAAKTALLCLQNPDDNNKIHSLAQIDPDNLEKGGDFLPSYVACDADLRQEKQDEDEVEKGHPFYAPASLRPGDPDFLSVPATSPRLRDEPDRIIFSLKSWLAQPTNVIKLPLAIQAQVNQEQAVTTYELPLRETLVSGYAGLAWAYIKKMMGFEPGGRIVLTHPNTFTTYHQQKMREIVFTALSKPLGIPLANRIHLLSESDAVAFYFCQQRIRKGLLMKRQSERMLVYDMGAGTLDLSLIKIEWHEEGRRPTQWQVENRLGVPIAGNYLDSILARLIDDCLKNQLRNAEGELIVVRPIDLEYKYPIVAKRLVPDEAGDTREHRIAIINLWRRIKETKHHWQGDIFKIEISQVKLSFGLIPLVGENTALFEQPPSDLTVPYLELEGNKLYLNIPANFLFNYPHMLAYTEFVTIQVIDQLIHHALDANNSAVEKSQVDTVVVTGRGAFWSGLYDKVWANFPHISTDKRHRPSLQETQTAKSAVVLGAIEWQELTKQVRPLPPKTKPRLAIKRSQYEPLVYQEEWGTKDAPKPIDLGASGTFELVEVSAMAEEPKPGFEIFNFNQYFQTVLMILSRDDYWEEDPTLYVYKIDSDGGLPPKIVMKNSKGEGEEFPTMDSISRVDSRPPWPIGSVLLEPLEAQAK